MPAPKPAFDAALDSGNSLTTNIVWASWFAEDEANPTRLTDASGNANHGTLTGLDPDYQMTVSGGSGSHAAYNQTYSPSGTEYGKTKYVSADSNYKLSFWYEMDPEMDGAWYLWAASASVPYMDGYVSYKGGNVVANGGTYSSTSPDAFAVAQGAVAPGPWFDDGLEFSGSGDARITAASALQIGTSDFSIIWRVTPDSDGVNVGRYIDSLDSANGNTGLVIGRGATTSTLHIELNDDSAYGLDITCSEQVYGVGVDHVLGLSVDRDGNAVVYREGTQIGSASIAAAAAQNVTSDAPIRIGGVMIESADYRFKGRWQVMYLWIDRVLSGTEHATVAADIYDLAAASGAAPTGRPMHLLQQVRESRSAQSVRVRNF